MTLGGLHISASSRSNLAELEDAVGWSPDNLKIERFGLNYDFIQRHRLTWIENLITSSGGDLGSPRHRDHFKPYVQSYIRKFGKRKVEGEALVRDPQAGRDLCRRAILQYVDEDEITPHRARLLEGRQEVRNAILELLQEEREE